MPALLPLPGSTCAAVGEQVATFVLGQRAVAGLRRDVWQVVCDVFRLQNQLPDAARIAIRLGDQVPLWQHCTANPSRSLPVARRRTHCGCDSCASVWRLSEAPSGGGRPPRAVRHFWIRSTGWLWVRRRRWFPKSLKVRRTSSPRSRSRSFWRGTSCTFRSTLRYHIRCFPAARSTTDALLRFLVRHSRSDDDNINAILNNDKLSENFLALVSADAIYSPSKQSIALAPRARAVLSGNAAFAVALMPRFSRNRTHRSGAYCGSAL